MVRSGKQNWQVGNTVKVGFLNLRILAVIPTPGNYLPDQYALTNDKGAFYSFIPHNGLCKHASLAEAIAW